MNRRSEDFGEQRAHEREIADMAHIVDMLTQTAKALGVLNGGGAVAMLGLLQALAQRQDQFFHFKQFGLLALALFVLGALGAALSFLARWQRSVWLLVEETTRQRNFWTRITFILFGFSGGAFLIACAIAGLGVERL